MGIGVIGAAAATEKSKALVDDVFYDSNISNISFPLEPGVYNVSAVSSFSLDGVSYPAGEQSINIQNGSSQISVANRAFEKNTAKTIFATYNGTPVTITRIFKGVTASGQQFLWGIGDTYVFTSVDDGVSWTAYNTLPNSLVGYPIKHPTLDYWLIVGNGGYHYYFSSNSISYSYTTFGFTTKANGWIFGDTTWVSFADDSDIAFRNDGSIDPTSSSGTVDLGGGTVDLDMGGYINGTYVVVDANGISYTSTTGSSWTQRSTLTWIRFTSGTYQHMFNWNNRLYAMSSNATTTPLYYTTDGINWQQDTSIVFPASGNWGTSYKIPFTNYYIFANSTLAQWYITEDFVTFTPSLGPSVGWGQALFPELSSDGKTIMVSNNGNLMELSLFDRAWVFDFVANIVDAN